MAIVFEALGKHHDRSAFSCGQADLDDWFRRRAGQDERTRLLAYAVNYGAVTGQDVGLMFAVHGLTGGYRGTYAVLPYHAMVRQYTDYENRDIWE